MIRFARFLTGRTVPPGPGSDERVTIIQPTSGWQLVDFRELVEYRDLFFFLVWRDIKVLYAQTILGFGWAVILPLAEIAIFGVVFGLIAKVPSEGYPYILFSSVAIIPWTYMSRTMTDSSQSLVVEQNMLGKVYFPRLIFPLTAVLSKLVDFGISMIIMVGVMLYYRVWPTWNLVYLPLFVLMMMAISASVGMWLSALAIRFRDVKHGMPFVIRMLMYTGPVVYSASAIPEAYRLIYSLNPIVGVIEGFRATMLGAPIPWRFVAPGLVTTAIVLISGALYFRRMERVFVDVI